MRYKFFLKLILSVLMLALVLRAVDFSKLQSIILSIPPWVAVAVVVGYLVGQLLSSLKWWLIASQAGVEASYPKALKAYFIGMFVNCFGLGIVGGDVARGILLSQGKPHKTPAIASVVADRMHGLVVLTLLATTSWILFGAINLKADLTLLLIIVTSSIVIGWFIGPAILLKIVPKEAKMRRKVEQLCEVFPRKLKVLIPITIVSILFHVLQISLHWLMGRGVGIYISWDVLFTTIPIVNILSSLPISWNGLGVREKSYVYFLTPAVLSQEQAVAFGAIWLFAVTISSAIGGMVSVLSKNSESLSEMKEEERCLTEN